MKFFLLPVSVGLLVLSSAAFSKDYYVAPNGGSGSGSLSEPWSLTHANAQLKPGDRAILRGGIYTDQAIKPATSGTASARITYVARNGETPQFRGSAPGRVKVLVDLTGRSYITVDGISADGEGIFEDSSFYQWVVFSDSRYCEVKNSNFYRSKGYSAILWQANTNASYNKFINNVVDTNGTWDKFPWTGAHDDSGSSFWIQVGNNYNLLEGNTFRRSGHDTGQVSSDFNIIRGNIFDNDWGAYEGKAFTFKQGDIQPGDRVGNRAMALKAGKYNLVENNIFRNVPESVDASRVGMVKVLGEKQIVRNNVFYKANDHGISIGIHKGEPKGEYNKIYHNVFYNLNGPAYYVVSYDNDYGKPMGTVFKNNVVYKTKLDPAESGEMYKAEIVFNNVHKWWGDTYLNNEFSNNCVAGDESASSQKVYLDGIGMKTLSEMQSIKPALFYGNIESAPSFVSSTPTKADDFKLSGTSACAGKGGDLTVTTNSGAGNKFRVADAGYFSDGFGVIKGDMVKVGSNAPVEVTSINYGTNEITVASSITWSSNAPVNLNSSSGSVDIGTLPSDVTVAEAPLLLAPTNLQLISR